jgi:toxin-antitoxin system PIN domain toxin
LILADVNVLVSAFREDAPHHSRCKPWLEGAVNEQAAFGLATVILTAVIRVTTNRRIYEPPSTTAGAIDFCNALLARPNACRLEPGDRHWDIFTSLCQESNVRGGLVTDAWLAALAIEHGCEFITLDRDFQRFRGLRWAPPRLN